MPVWEGDWLVAIETKIAVCIAVRVGSGGQTGFVRFYVCTNVCGRDMMSRILECMKTTEGSCFFTLLIWLETSFTILQNTMNDLLTRHTRAIINECLTLTLLQQQKGEIWPGPSSSRQTGY